MNSIQQQHQQHLALQHQVKVQQDEDDKFPYHAVDLNNEAAREMNQGNYSLASQLLTKALTDVKSAVRRPAAAATTRGEESSTSSHSCSCAFTTANHASSMSRTSSSASIPEGEENSESRFLFSHPIHVFTPNNKEDGPSSFPPELLETLSYAVVYNLALCAHLRAISTTAMARHQTFLRQATALYSHAQKLLMNSYNNNNNNQNAKAAMDPLHSLALVNNLGHAHYMLNNEPSAKQCFQHLLRTIMRMSHAQQQQQQYGDNTTTNTTTHLDGFLSNIMAVMGTASCAPAA